MEIPLNRETDPELFDTLSAAMDRADEWCKRMYAAGLIKPGDVITAEKHRRIDALWAAERN